MSKVLAGTAFVLLGGATATGGVLLLSRGSKNPEGNGKTETEQIDAELSKTLAEFKATDKSKGCLKTLFPTLQEISNTEDSAEINNSFFTSGKKITGCLVVNWDKYTKTESGTEKWHGNFRFLWAVKEETKGFIVFLAGKTPSTSGQQEIQWEGGIYKLEEDSSTPKKWIAKKQQEIATTPSSKSFKKEGGSADAKKFPQPGDQWKGKDDSTDAPTFWGLMGDGNDLDKIAASTSTEASQTPSSFLRAYWSWESQTTGDNRKKLSDWSKDWDSWWKSIFEETKFKAKELGEAQQGIWSRKKYDLDSKTNVGGSSGG